MVKFIIFLAIVYFFWSPAQAMNKSIKILPISILLDSGSAQESVQLTTLYKQNPGAISTELSVYLQQCFCPIIASDNLLHAILAYRSKFTKDLKTKKNIVTTIIQDLGQNKKIQLQYPTNPIQIDVFEDQSINELLEIYPGIQFAYFATKIPFEKWHIYSLSIHNTHLYLMIPKKFTQKTLLSRNSLLKNISFNQIEKDILDNKIPQYTAPTIEALSSALTIFTKSLHNQGIIVTLTGHGLYTKDKLSNSPSQKISDQGTIACLSLYDFRNFLEILEKLKTKYFYYDSCYAGGYHLILPYFKENSALSLSFPIISRSADNRSTYTSTIDVQFDSKNNDFIISLPLNPQKFFDLLLQPFKKNKSYQNIELSDITKHMISNLYVTCYEPPMMIRPKHASYFLPVINKSEFVLTNVKAYCHAHDKTPIKTKAKMLFLLSHYMNNTIEVEEPMLGCLAPRGGIFFIHQLTVNCPTKKNLHDLLIHMFFNNNMQENKASTYILVGLMQQLIHGKSASIFKNILAVNNHNKSFIIYNKANNFQRLEYLADKKCFSEPKKLRSNIASSIILRTIKNVPPFDNNIERNCLYPNRETLAKAKDYLQNPKPKRAQKLTILWKILNSQKKLTSSLT